MGYPGFVDFFVKEFPKNVVKVRVKKRAKIKYIEELPIRTIKKLKVSTIEEFLAMDRRFRTGYARNTKSGHRADLFLCPICNIIELSHLTALHVLTHVEDRDIFEIFLKHSAEYVESVIRALYPDNFHSTGIYLFGKRGIPVKSFFKDVTEILDV